MPLRSFEPESHTGPCFDTETVRQATVLAERLQEERRKERREKLSLAEIDALATEVGIDPECMRQALDVVLRSKASKATTRERTGFSAPKRICAAAGISILLFAGLAGFAPRGDATHVTVLAATPMPQGPLLIRNGSFEAEVKDQLAQSLKPGSRAIRKWKVTRGTAQRVAGVATAGEHSLLLGPRAAVRLDTFPTEPGQTYRVRFDMAGKPGAEPAVRRLQVAGPGMYWEHSCFTPAAGEGPLRWAPQSLELDASEVGTSLGWVNVSEGPIYIDNVRISRLVGGLEVPASDP